MFECGGLIISSFATLKLNVIKYDQPAFYVYKYTVCVRICLNRSMIYYISYIYVTPVVPHKAVAEVSKIENL